MIPLVELPDGSMWSWGSILAGAVFVARDYAQRAIGHHVLWLMVLATGLSYFMADPFVAIASAAAFAVSELADYLVYSVTKKPFYQRILLSSAVSVPVDTAVFLGILGLLSPFGLVVMIASKMIAAGVVWEIERGR